MKELFQFVLENYLEANKVISKNDAVFQTLTKYIPNELRNVVNSKFIVKGSMGQSYKSDSPWIAILNPDITTTTQSGIYIAFLFKKDMSGFYLALNQGIKNFAELFGKYKYENAIKIAKYFQNEIGETNFSTEEINLGNIKSGSRSYGYEKTTIISKFYYYDKYNDNIIFNDLNELIEIYNFVSKIFETSDYNDVIKKILASEQKLVVDGSTALQEIKKCFDDGIDSDDFNKELEEKIPYIDKTIKFEKITSPILNKIDYIKKATRDLKVGLRGEALVISFEKKRLSLLGRDDLEEKVRWVSRESDGYGYDIESFEIDSNGKEYPIKIEVKTTTSKIDIDFFVSKNELEASKKFKKNYCIFRLYDLKNNRPKFYRVYGEITDNFYLDPVTYMARYKLLN